jgi:hypothetical protein
LTIDPLPPHHVSQSITCETNAKAKEGIAEPIEWNSAAPTTFRPSPTAHGVSWSTTLPATV